MQQPTDQHHDSPSELVVSNESLENQRPLSMPPIDPNRMALSQMSLQGQLQEWTDTGGVHIVEGNQAEFNEELIRMEGDQHIMINPDQPPQFFSNPPLGPAPGPATIAPASTRPQKKAKKGTPKIALTSDDTVYQERQTSSKSRSVRGDKNQRPESWQPPPRGMEASPTKSFGSGITSWFPWQSGDRNKQTSSSKQQQTSPPQRLPVPQNQLQVLPSSRNPDSESDDPDYQDLLRYSPNEQLNILHKRCKKLQMKHERDQNTIRDMQERNEWCDKIMRDHDFIVHERDRALQEYEQLLQDRDDLQARYEQEKMRLQSRANESDLEVQDLKKEIRRLKEEASLYQSALGSATNVRWSDGDINNSVQLTSTINELQHALSDFSKVKGAGLKVHENEANNLLARYGCKTTMSDKRPKPVLSGALQRLTLDMIFDEIESYLSDSNSEQHPPVNEDQLERDIIGTTQRLIELVKAFSRARSGNDQLTEVTPVKLRQQIYAILGSRAFVKDGESHPFVTQLRDKLIQTVEKYRSFTDQRKQQEQGKEVARLIHDVVHLYFRLHTQEPIPKFRKFFESGEPLRLQTMAGPWNEDDLEDLIVEICSFPIVEYTEGNRILSKAQVLPRPKDDSYEQ